MYIDFLLIINFIIDFIILKLEAYYLKEKISIKKIILGCLVGEASLFLLFININKISIIIFKFLISVVMQKITFKNTNNIILFYILSLTLGGLIYIIKNNIINNLYLIYIVVPFIFYKIIKYIKNKNKLVSLKHKLKIIIENKEYELYGFVDTGNTIKDPYMMMNIVIVSKSLIKEKLNILVPCETASGDSVIHCIKPDKIYIDDNLYKNLLVGEAANKLTFALIPNVL